MKPISSASASSPKSACTTATSASYGITAGLQKIVIIHPYIHKFSVILQENKSHRILIVADAFGKPAYNPRLRYLCNYLVTHGWSVDVYTEQLEPLTFQHSYKIVEIQVYFNRTLDWIIKSICTILFDWKSRYLSRRLQCLTANQQYDIVMVSTFLPTPLRAALQVAQARHIPLHIDLRDIDEQTPTNQYRAHSKWRSRLLHQLYRTINIHRRNTIIRQANSISSVSPWHIHHLKRWNNNVSLIYNGYDEQTFVPSDLPTNEFVIVYTGRIYDASLQDPFLFFKALQQMSLSDRLPKELVVKWYTDQQGKKRVSRWSKQTGTLAYMQFYPYVKVEDIPALLHTSSIVLVASKKSTSHGPHGIMTTKFFEALGVEKPVLCVPSDEECLADVILQTNAGVAASTVEEVQAFILDKYAEWKANGYTRQAVNQEQKQLFTRQYQARQFEELLLKAIHEKR